MRIDLYTKLVLTVIAACLVWICVRGTVLSTPVQAQARPQPQEVIIAGVKTPDKLFPVRIESINTPPNQMLSVGIADIRNSTHSLPVNVTGLSTPDQLLPVSIASIKSPDQLLPVKIANVSSKSQLPVSLESVKQGANWDALSVRTVSDTK